MKKDNRLKKLEESNLSHSNDTLFLSVQDYKILLSNNDILDIEVTSQQAISMIKNFKYSVIEVEFKKEKMIAKGNDLFSSFVPQDCDYFYAFNNDGYIFFINNKITFNKVIKSAH